MLDNHVKYITMKKQNVISFSGNLVPRKNPLPLLHFFPIYPAPANKSFLNNSNK